MKIHQKVTAAIAGVALGCASGAHANNTQKITLIHIGDTHGQIEDVTDVTQAHRFLKERRLLGRLITNWWDPSRQAWIDQHREVVTH